MALSTLVWLCCQFGCADHQQNFWSQQVWLTGVVVVGCRGIKWLGLCRYSTSLTLNLLLFKFKFIASPTRLISRTHKAVWSVLVRLAHTRYPAAFQIQGADHQTSFVTLQYRCDLSNSQSLISTPPSESKTTTTCQCTWWPQVRHSTMLDAINWNHQALWLFPLSPMHPLTSSTALNPKAQLLTSRMPLASIATSAKHWTAVAIDFRNLPACTFEAACQTIYWWSAHSPAWAYQPAYHLSLLSHRKS